MDVKFIILIVFGIVVMISFLIVVFTFLCCNELPPRPHSPSRRSTAELKTSSRETWYQTANSRAPRNKSSIEDSDEDLEETIKEIQRHSQHEKSRKETKEDEKLNILEPSTPEDTRSGTGSTCSSMSFTIQEYNLCHDNQNDRCSPVSLKSPESLHSHFSINSPPSLHSSVSPNIRELQANLLENIQKRNSHNITRVHPEARRALPSFLPPSSIENHISSGCNRATARDVSIQRFTKDGTICNIVFDVDPLDFSVTTRASSMEKVIKSNLRVRTWMCERGGGFSLNELENWTVTDQHYCFAIFRHKDGILLMDHTLQSGTKRTTKL